MSKSIRLRVCGAVSIHGRKPGEDFDAPRDDDGVILDLLTRKRVADGSFIEAIAAPTPAPQPQATPAQNKEG